MNPTLRIKLSAGRSFVAEKDGNGFRVVEGSMSDLGKWGQDMLGRWIGGAAR